MDQGASGEEANDIEDWQPFSTLNLREITDEEKLKLEKDLTLVTEFKQNKLEKEAQKNWDLFYKRNTTKFFKDRHWTKREFSELKESKSDGKRTVFEVGCGVGNFMFPVLEDDPEVFFYACDFSKRAVNFVKENPLYDTSRCLAFHCDITQDELTNHITESTVDLATMIFVLSAIHPDKMLTALQNVFKVLRPGGHLLFRDYGMYDYAMLRFAPGHKLSENFYVRQDGTRAYYFTIEKLTELMKDSGFEVSSCEYIHRQTVNKKEGVSVPRIFVQGKFQRPPINSSFDKTTVIESDIRTNVCISASDCENNAKNENGNVGDCSTKETDPEQTTWNSECSGTISCDNITDNNDRSTDNSDVKRNDSR